MNQQIAFLTTIFPMQKEYLYDFFNSLKKQTYKEFDIIVVNDGYENFKELESKYSELNIIELKYSNTPAKNREYGINYCIDKKYDILIFGDSDDYFKDNRIQISIEKLAKYDIVVNDLSLFNSDGIYCQKYISNRIKNNTEIDLEFIKDKNIFGMSNTSIKIDKLDKIYFDTELIAVDWYFFSTLLISKYKAVFTTETKTFYRQYDGNTVGIGSITSEMIVKGIKVKLKHYELLAKKDIKYKNLLINILKLQKKMKDSEITNLIQKQVIKNSFWWEDIKLIEEVL